MNKILLIEDDPLMARLYKKIFEREAFVVETAERGEDGLLKVKNNPPNLILLDIMMPEMDGFEVLGKLKDDSQTKDIPVVTLTNLAGDADRDKAIAMGANAHIIKSEKDPNEVVEIVKKVLEVSSVK